MHCRHVTEDEALNGWFSDVFKFKKFEGKKFLGAIVKKPSRLLTGVDPWSTKVWNTVKGSHDVGLVDQWGGTSKENIAAAKKAGINIGPGMTMEKIAHMVAAFYAGGALSQAAGSTYAGTAFDTANSIAKIQATRNAQKAALAAQMAATSSQYLDLPGGPGMMTTQGVNAQGYYAPGAPPPVYDPNVSHAKLPEWALPAGAALLVVIAAAALSKGK